jgi:predicted nuclease of restriction endonuclease-like (RecB) superfamily
MALTVMVEATVTYKCMLSKEDEIKINEYIGDTDLSVADAIIDLYYADQIDLYQNYTESDFETNHIISEIYREED